MKSANTGSNAGFIPSAARRLAQVLQLRRMNNLTHTPNKDHRGRRGNETAKSRLGLSPDCSARRHCRASQASDSTRLNFESLNGLLSDSRL
jgi:hypothetical protein